MRSLRFMGVWLVPGNNIAWLVIQGSVRVVGLFWGLGKGSTRAVFFSKFVGYHLDGSHVVRCPGAGRAAFCGCCESAFGGTHGATASLTAEAACTCSFCEDVTWLATDALPQCMCGLRICLRRSPAHVLCAAPANRRPPLPPFTCRWPLVREEGK